MCVPNEKTSKYAPQFTPGPQNNVESVRNENNKATLIGGGMEEVCSM